MEDNKQKKIVEPDQPPSYNVRSIIIGWKSMIKVRYLLHPQEKFAFTTVQATGHPSPVYELQYLWFGKHVKD